MADTFQKVNKKLDEELKNAGFPEEYVDSNIFYVFEEELGIGHFKFSGSSEERSGHILLSTFNDKWFKKNIQSVIK
jgi:hypothetical protein